MLPDLGRPAVSTRSAGRGPARVRWRDLRRALLWHRRLLAAGLAALAVALTIAALDPTPAPSVAILAAARDIPGGRLVTDADLITVAEHKPAGRVKVVLSWVPHVRALPQCVPNSFAEWFAEVSWVDLTITHPPGYELAPQFTKGARIEYDQKKAFEGADFIYAKNWSSYEPYGQVLSTDPAWLVSPDHMTRTNQGRLLHCLPVRRNVEVADAVLDSPQSLIIPEAANRVFAMQTVLRELFRS